MEQPGIEVIADGLGLVASPRYHQGAVLFSDWTTGQILRSSTAGLEVVAEVASFPLCFDTTDDGEMFVLDGARGLLLRGPIEGPLRPWVDVGSLSKGAANEVRATAHGVYLNFGNFDPRTGFPAQPVGLVVHVAHDGAARVVARDLAFPNGMALTSDGRLLVAESHGHRISAWHIHADGSLTDRHIWANTPELAPDGITLTPQGTCWLADVDSKSVVHVTEGEHEIERITLDRGAFSCVHTAEHNTLYVTAAHWPGGQRMFDPTHRWDGQVIAVRAD